MSWEEYSPVVRTVAPAEQSYKVITQYRCATQQRFARDDDFLLPDR